MITGWRAPVKTNSSEITVKEGITNTSRLSYNVELFITFNTSPHVFLSNINIKQINNKPNTFTKLIKI